MEESNKPLALLLVAAIVVSLGGTVVSLNRLGTLELVALTGRATSDTGGVNLTVADNTAIEFTATSVDFGSGWVTEAADNCTMTTNSATGTGAVSAACGSNWATPTDTGLVFKNTGNTNISVNLTSDVNAATFIGGSIETPAFEWKVVSAHTTSLGDNDDSAAGCTGAGWTTTSFTTIATGADVQICAGDFSPDSAMNEGVIDFRLVIPKDADQDSNDATITIEATS